MAPARRCSRPARPIWRTGLLGLLLFIWSYQVPDLFPGLGAADPTRSASAVLQPAWHLNQNRLQLEVYLPAVTPMAILIDRLDGRTVYAQRLTPPDTAYVTRTMDLSTIPDGLYFLRLKAGGQTRSRLILL